MSEVPFFADRRKRAGLVRRIGNLAAKIDSEQPEFVAMYVEATRSGIDPTRVSHLKQMMACHLEFVSPYAPNEVDILARTTGLSAELTSLRNLPEDLRGAPEVVRVAFVDVAAVVKNSVETA